MFILLVFGIVVEVIVNNMRCLFWGYCVMVGLILVFVFLFFIVWVYYMFLIGMGMVISSFF